MTLRRIMDFLRDARAAASLEYVVLLLPLIALVFTSFQIALAYHFALTAQKAVENGARIAAVRDPVHTALVDLKNTALPGRQNGESCSAGACEAPAGGPWVCSGADLGQDHCDAAAFTEIYNEVNRIAYLLTPEQLTVSYYNARLGFAGGPFVPIVEVKIQERPFIFQFFFNLALSDGSKAGDSEAKLLPAVAASAVAEDLKSVN